MCPSNFSPFKASPELVQCALRARESARAEELPQLDLTSSRLPDPRVPLDLQLAQEAIGERCLSLLSALALSSGAAPARLLIMPDERHFVAEVRAGLAEFLGLSADGEPLARFLALLAAEFYRWVRTHPQERQDFGLELDGRGRLLLECPDVRPDLEPLPE